MRIGKLRVPLQARLVVLNRSVVILQSLIRHAALPVESVPLGVQFDGPVVIRQRFGGPPQVTEGLREPVITVAVACLCANGRLETRYRFLKLSSALETKSFLHQRLRCSVR